MSDSNLSPMRLLAALGSDDDDDDDKHTSSFSSSNSLPCAKCELAQLELREQKRKASVLARKYTASVAQSKALLARVEELTEQLQQLRGCQTSPGPPPAPNSPASASASPGSDWPSSPVLQAASEPVRSAVRVLPGSSRGTPRRRTLVASRVRVEKVGEVCEDDVVMLDALPATAGKARKRKTPGKVSPLVDLTVASPARRSTNKRSKLKLRRKKPKPGESLAEMNRRAKDLNEPAWRKRKTPNSIAAAQRAPILVNVPDDDDDDHDPALPIRRGGPKQQQDQPIISEALRQRQLDAAERLTQRRNKRERELRRSQPSSSSSSSSSSSAAAPRPTKDNRGNPLVNFTVRTREERDALMGFSCDQCRAFYKANHELDPALSRNSNSTSLCDHVSRHRFQVEPTSTPPRYWSLSDDWLEDEPA